MKYTTLKWIPLVLLWGMGFLPIWGGGDLGDDPGIGPYLVEVHATDFPAGYGFEDLPPLNPESDFHASDPRLEDLLGTMLTANPDILAARRRWLAGLERPAQVNSLPDPQLNLRYFAAPIETRVGPQNAVLELSQPVPWLSKLSAQKQWAEQMAAGTRAQVRVIERDRVREFKTAWYELAYAREALRINEGERALLSRFEQIALTRYSSGQGIQQNVIKVQTEISRLLDQRSELLKRRAVLGRKLERLLGGAATGLETTIISLPDPTFHIDRDGMEEQALAARPEIRALGMHLEADGTLIARRQLEWRPDFRFGLQYVAVGDREDFAGQINPPADNGEDALAIVAGVRIPVHGGRIRSGVREAQQDREARLKNLESERDRIRFEVQEVLLRLESLTDRAALYRDTLIPQAEQSMSTSEAAYQTNRIGFLDLIDAERIWFQVRLAYRRVQSEAWIAGADLERALGREFPDDGVVSKPESAP